MNDKADRHSWHESAIDGATWLSLLFLGIIVLFWVRSYFVRDTFSRDDSATELISSVGVIEWFGYAHHMSDARRRGISWDTTDPVIEDTTFGFAFGRLVGTADISTHIAAPHWVLAILFGLLPSRQLNRARRANRVESLIQSRRCPSCGYDLRATPNRCPECGADVRAGDGGGHHR